MSSTRLSSARTHGGAGEDVWWRGWACAECVESHGGTLRHGGHAVTFPSAGWTTWTASSEGWAYHRISYRVLQYFRASLLYAEAEWMRFPPADTIPRRKLTRLVLRSRPGPPSAPPPSSPLAAIPGRRCDEVRIWTLFVRRQAGIFVFLSQSVLQFNTSSSFAAPRAGDLLWLDSLPCFLSSPAIPSDDVPSIITPISVKSYLYRESSVFVVWYLPWMGAMTA